MSSLDVPPVVCNLTIGRRVEQELEWADLAQHAESRTAISGGVESTFSLELADQIEELADRELACCGSWLNIAHQRDAKNFRLRLTTTNPEGISLIRSMSGL